MRSRWGLAVLMLIFFIPLAAVAEESATDAVYLETIEVTAPKDTTNRVTQTEIERKTATTLWEALRGVPGVYQTTSGARGESVILIRGSNRYQVGMYVDGVPTATAYRNEWDYNNSLTFDLDSIEVSKGYSSPLLQSSNGLAGVINVKTRKPQKELEFKAKYMNFFDRHGDDQSRLFGASIGTRQEMFYLQAQVIHDEQDFFTLSDSFNAGRDERGDRRENSDYKNRRLNLVGGFTPTDDVDIMFGIVKQQFEKGQPPDASRSGTNRFWRWPEYDTDRYYMNADLRVNPQAKFQVVAYYDEHTDKSVDYTDATYSAIAANSRDQTYEQYTAGGQVKFEYEFNSANILGTSVGYRRLSHKDKRYRTTTGNATTGSRSNWGLNEEDVEDYYDVGAEYTFQPISPLTLVFGASYTRLEPVTADTYQQGSLVGLKDKSDIRQDMFNYQVGAFYDVTTDHQMFFTFAKKSRPATMRERYWRTGDAPANPDIDPEEALHFELGYRGMANKWLKLNASAYYSMYDDKIASTRDANNNTIFDNIDKADIYGLELGAEAFINSWVSVGATASFMDWDTDANTRTMENLTDAPKVVGNIYAEVMPTERLSIVPEVYMTSDFYNSANPDAANKKSAGFAVFNLKAAYDISKNITVEAGVKNLLDQDYYYNYYFPEAGRTYFVGLSADF